jgi:hypothetical protein
MSESSTFTASQCSMGSEPVGRNTVPTALQPTRLYNTVLSWSRYAEWETDEVSIYLLTTVGILHGHGLRQVDSFRRRALKLSCRLCFSKTDVQRYQVHRGKSVRVARPSKAKRWPASVVVGARGVNEWREGTRL